MKFTSLFKPDYQRYEGLSPIRVHLMRLGFVMVFVFVGNISLSSIVNHHGSWDPLAAAALCMWAAHSLLSLIGVFKPLRMLPLFLFEIVYKLLWLAIVAWPLWSTNQLAGSPADMTYAFLSVAVPIMFIPWRYVFRKFVWSRVAVLQLRSE